MEDWQNGGFGIYFHWPFCQSKCPYCDFNSHVSGSVDQDAWGDAYLCEIDRVAAETSGRLVQSIYFGGGTPSLMAPSLVAKILDRVRLRWSLTNDVEITLEANPSSVEIAKFRDFRSAGVNRVSLGVQSLRDDDLRMLGRMHSVSEAKTAIDVAQSVFERTSFDLIYARQNQDLMAWEAELAEGLALANGHLSLYQL
ncbi:coproporphyrinogen-III oxidase family protein, partial [Celeribacter marinus]|uniref:coproporphyrinogen-III oxidase family protein n=1 Tax=Celeribacter marinus TaxID=1397108 RepID=UPI003F6D5260